MNLTAVNDTVTPANSVSLYYNPSNKLQNADGSWGQSTWYYDGVGNRTYDINTVAAVTSTTVQGYGLATNRLVNMTVNGTTARTFAYDGAGNITSDTRPGEVFATTYNKRNRPVSVTRNGAAYATYGYNALEQLVSRSTSAVGGPVGSRTTRVGYIPIHLISDLKPALLLAKRLSSPSDCR
jgi:YD repeat-containing protein